MFLKGVQMGKKRRRYSREFKLEAVRMVVEQGRTQQEVAAGLGISNSLVHTWKERFLAEGAVAFPGQGKRKPAEEELDRLRKELSTVRQERDILKKALAYFANEER